MNVAVIVAGGSGARMGGEVPKQFVEVCGKPIIIRCMERFDAHEEIDEIIVVCQAGFIQLLREQAAAFGIRKLARIAEAGATRRASVLSGLRAVRDENAVVLIHDAARPLVSARIISENIAAVHEAGAAVTAMPAVDTMFISEDGAYAGRTLARGALYHAQTPQSFRYGLILAAHLAAADGEDATDDCQLAVAAGHRVAIVAGDAQNFKVTTPADLVRLQGAVACSDC